MSSEPIEGGSDALGAAADVGPTQPVSPKPASPQRAPPQRRCRYFRSGHCSYGDQCKFLHQPSSPARAEASANAVAEKPICRYYQQGWCRLGARCSFAHQRLPVRQAANATAGASGSSRVDSKTLREAEIAHFVERFPQHTFDGEWLVFKFCPSDPDWPYDVRQLQLSVTFPERYPAEPFAIKLGTNETIPETVSRQLNYRIAELAAAAQPSRSTNGKVKGDRLPFRAFLNELDKQIEGFLTASLQVYQRELKARAAGMQFVPCYELPGFQAEKDRGRTQGPTLPSRTPQVQEGRQRNECFSSSQTLTAEGSTYSKAETASSVEQNRSQSTSTASSNLEDNEDDESLDDDGYGAAAVAAPTAAARPQGTEVRLRGLQFVGAVGTLLCTRLALVVSCGRCHHRELLPVSAGAAATSECSRCHEPQTVAYESAMVHSSASTLGYLRPSGCMPFDVALVDCLLTVGCLNCNKDDVLQGIHPGVTNEHWCRHCHHKMKLTAEKCSFTVYGSAAAGAHIGKENVEKVRRTDKSRNVKHPAVRDGEPLPDNGACVHFKKSYRWFRFPCCGKLYPCTSCHDAQEHDHVGEMANRIVCGFCCKEQPLSAGPCLSCGSFLNRHKTSHWEGGKGCRDVFQMDRRDARKYAGMDKTISRRQAKTSEAKGGRKNKTSEAS